MKSMNYIEENIDIKELGNPITWEDRIKSKGTQNSSLI